MIIYQPEVLEPIVIPPGMKEMYARIVSFRSQKVARNNIIQHCRACQNQLAKTGPVITSLCSSVSYLTINMLQYIAGRCEFSTNARES